MADFSNIKVYAHLKAGRDGKLLAMLTTNNKLDEAGCACIYFDDDITYRHRQERGSSSRFVQKPAIVENSKNYNDGDEAFVVITHVADKFILVRVVEIISEGNNIADAMVVSESITDWQRAAIRNFLDVAKKATTDKVAEVFCLKEADVVAVLHDYARSSTWERVYVDTALISLMKRASKLDMAAMLLSSNSKIRARAITKLIS